MTEFRRPEGCARYVFCPRQISFVFGKIGRPKTQCIFCYLLPTFKNGIISYQHYLYIRHIYIYIHTYIHIHVSYLHGRYQYVSIIKPSLSRFSGKCGLPAKPCPVARPTLNCVHEERRSGGLGFRTRVDNQLAGGLDCLFSHIWGINIPTD